jgi:hypothetical protein
MCGIGEGGEINRWRLHQLDKSGWALPDMVIINVPQPTAIATYRCNRIHADKLQMDRNLITKYWDKRFNLLGVLGIVCVNAYLFF